MSCDDLSGIMPKTLDDVCLGSGGTHQDFSDTSLEKNLLDYLASRSIISCVFDDRIFAHQVSRKNQTWPVLTYYVDKDHDHVLSGSAAVATADVHLDIWSHNYFEVINGAEAVRQVMQGFHSGWWGCVAILSVTIEDDSDDIHAPLDGSNVWTYSRSLDFAVTYQESVPTF